jgi:hypothetical protein
MMPENQNDVPTATGTPPTWLSIAALATARAVSIRTVKRWIENGQVETHKDGGRRLVRDTKGTRQKGHDPASVSPLAPSHSRKEGHVEGTRGTQAVSPSPDFAALLVAQLQTENAFLRGVVEQLQRDGAETRAALREALKAAPKGLPAPSETSPQNAVESPRTRKSSSSNTNVVLGKKVAQNGGESGLTYGDLADWLEGI